jgi:hypothetical protein
MNSGEIRVLRLEHAQRGAETIETNFGVDAPTQLLVVDEQIPVIDDVFGAHGSYCEILLSAVAEAGRSPLGVLASFLARGVQPDAARPSRPRYRRRAPAPQLQLGL